MLLKNWRFVFLIIGIFGNYHVLGHSNENERSLSTSVAGMIELLETENLMLQILNNYANELHMKLDIIRGAISQMRAELQKSEQNVEAYLANPINAFSLIRRMHADWLSWVLYLEKPIGEFHINQIKAQLSKMPTSTDLHEATNAIHRLQTTYDMKPADMAVGRLNGKQYDVKFSALDLYTVGYELLRNTNVFDSSYWLYAALQSFTDNNLNTVFEFSKRKIYEVYAEALFKQNRYKDAQIVLDKALKYEPNDAELLKRKRDIEFFEATKASLLPPIAYSSPQITQYHVGCRGEFPVRPYNLYCRYNTTTTDFLKLAPIKMEEISLDPYMILYHDVISDEEIEHLKNLGRAGLRRATVYNETDKQSTVVSSRTSKFAWLNDNTTEVTRRINQRIIDMTGFDIRGSEMLQVMNYGLGGHYDTHHDFFNFSMNEEVVRMQGDRIATVLFYMSDVEQGGATVFPHIKVAVLPQKGTAVMWYNLNNRGVGDGNTMHAACPVIVGSKWVCNKWIRERNQFRSRPCPKE